MLSKEELKDMTAGADGQGLFVSLYLDVNPATNPKGEYLVWFRNHVREKAASMDKASFKEVERTLTEIDAFLQDNKREFKKGLAIISHTSKPFLRIDHYPLPFLNELIIDEAPYIKPLVDNHHKYAVVLVDKESARIFVARKGEITEYGEMHSEDVPGRHKKGGWHALSQNHYDRHIERHVALHIKDVIGSLDHFLRAGGIDKLIIGGADAAAAKTVEMLGGLTSANILGTFSAGMFESSLEVLARAESIMNAHEKKVDEDTVSDLIARAMKLERSTVGLNNVLAALQEGRILKLVLQRDFKANGLVCAGCEAIMIKSPEGRCPYCGGELRDVGHIADLAVKQVLKQGAGVKLVSESAELQRVGNIGAFLRF